MSNPNTNRDFTSSLLSRCFRHGVMPAMAISMLAGTATAQDSSGFGLLAALKSQAKASAPEPEPTTISEETTGFAPDDAQADMPYDEFADEQGDLSDLDGAVDVSEYDLVDLHVNNEDLGNILQLLSIQSQRNIISSKDVAASVTADLYGVTFYEALDSILHVNGYGYVEKGNFIYVYTSEQLAELEALSRQPITRIITLDYLNATDAGEFAKLLLSESGTITTNAQTEAFSINDGSPTGADNYANSATIVIHDFEENIDEVAELIAELDTKPAQILIEATILQTTLNEANAFGMDFALIQNLDFSDFVGLGGPLNAVDGLFTGTGETVDGTKVHAGAGHGSALSSTVGNTSGPASLKAGFVNGDVGVFMRVLDEITDVTVVSNPKLLTLNRQPARVLVGTRVGYLNSTTTDTSTTQSVEFLDVGTQLSVRPFVSKNGLIRLELRPQVSNFTLRQVSDGAGNNVTIPDEDTTEMNTNVMIRDGQTVVLGGLFTETTSATRRQVPVLGDIPLVGNAFKGFDDSTRRSEIIFLITPTIVNDTVLAETGDMGNQYLEHARYGARKSLLPWSRERGVGQLLIDARMLADSGEIEYALDKVDRALRLMPMSPDARALRTELTGEFRKMPSRSLIDGMLNGELDSGSESTSSNTPSTTIDPFADFDAGLGADTSFEPVSSTSGEFTAEPAGTEELEQTQLVENVEVTPTDGFDQMKSLVTGEDTSVDFADVDPDWFYESVDTDMTAQAETAEQDASLESFLGTDTTQSSFSVAAQKFGGQLIIPLPSGGSLRLDWPLSFDYVAQGIETDSQSTVTEVETSSDDFGE